MDLFKSKENDIKNKNGGKSCLDTQKELSDNELDKVAGGKVGLTRPFNSDGIRKQN